ncbi:hypothetical protein GUJ93_ZPchr0005g15007 [Zizania palustris]|uniref:Uncharacterized protein n=1 Tax=Zizania palustris TaxID=103762 RepID=A0A8J5VEK2_ZIZPA|nr:hypothetical protein GUJ93_ZPchr0005g15007 [Zizania palustris]
MPCSRRQLPLRRLMAGAGFRSSKVVFMHVWEEARTSSTRTSRAVGIPFFVVLAPPTSSLFSFGMMHRA